MLTTRVHRIFQRRSEDRCGA